MEEPTRLIAVRHGETAWNVDTRIQGQLDIGLNATGVWQAQRAGAALADEPIGVVYASDLSRAWQTAQEIARPHGLAVQPEPGLRERAFGRFEGMSFAEIESTLPEQARIRRTALQAARGSGQLPRPCRQLPVPPWRFVHQFRGQHP